MTRQQQMCERLYPTPILLLSALCGSAHQYVLCATDDLSCATLQHRNEWRFEQKVKWNEMWNGMEWNGTVRRVQGSTSVARVNITARIAW